ncbi:cytochrome c [Terasakiella sp. A23]|uniref:cytochrome c n=1 Tax=Terasakiella sp. FCG-A23 TaxID=3080561 RepID=UPI002955556C|nr:cytochrome c [Terasakiella sp. A23]MDV7340623.1 cytochrome c [Terasakiella sp. A23]
MKRIIASMLGVCALTACTLTPQEPKVLTKVWLEQGWNKNQRHWYHHASQGSFTFPVPYEWFVELEQPIRKDNIVTSLIGASNKLSDPDYLSGFGFISSEISRQNPDGLPVGFAETKGVTDPASGTKFNAIGLTCAGCHTGQMTYEGTNIRIDGGPAVTDLTTFGLALVETLSETYIDPLRHTRFRENVIKRILEDDPTTTKIEQEAIFKATYKKIMEGIIKQGEQTIKTASKSVTEGYTRLDALNRIGNTVFGAYNDKNIAPTDAPVNYPHIWSTSWFDWVQYDASIMAPMIRNAGEALGVGAPVELNPTPHQFASTVNFKNQFGMEAMLAGKEHPQSTNSFNGLKAPKWPEKILGDIDMAKAAQGEKLYEEHCQACHRPAVSKKEFWSNDYWKQIKGKGERFYEVVVVPVSEIGTDSAQADVLPTRTVDLTGMGKGISGNVCAQADDKWLEVPVSAKSDESFAFALGLTVQRTSEFFYKTNNISPEMQKKMEWGRENCLQAPHAYKARPLNGIWATAPFLHNSTVPSLYDMLLPANERPSTVYLGYQEFDPKKVGFISTREDGLTTTKGLTKVVVSGEKAKPGNFNKGHEFSDNKGPGVIGPLLTEEERWALVEYLKTL